MGRKKPRKSQTAPVAGHPSPGAAEFAPEIDLHALTVMEALDKLDEFIHDAFQAGHYRVRVNHGKGTGVLKLEVGRYLAGHPLVIGHRQADVWHGGSGVTEADLSYR
jgi:DNA mismatch repair protein MutS2